MGNSFSKPASMRGAVLPQQGRTNISDGVSVAVDVILGHEAIDCSSTHHVLVLLSDGAHNEGPPPEEQLPILGAMLRQAAPLVRLSVVVVGVTNSSNTAIGMLLKQSLETVALPMMQPIYFADTPWRMGEVLKDMQIGLASLRGSLVRIALEGDGGFVQAVGKPPANEVNLMAESNHSLICVAETAPASLSVDGMVVACEQLHEGADFDVELASAALQPLLHAVRVKRVAQGATSVRPALEQLKHWASAIESRLVDQQRIVGVAGLSFAKVAPQSRIAQHKLAKGLIQSVRLLRNQLADIEACHANDSASQASFLMGGSCKYAAKALRRADGPGARSFEELLANTCNTAAKIRKALRNDLCAKIAGLCCESRARLQADLTNNLQPNVSRAAVRVLCSATVEEASSNAEVVELLDSGSVVGPLESILGGSRQSYLSLHTAFEQLSEWCNAVADASTVCHSEYELLMYLGVVGYPIEVKRRAATQMNPYAMSISRVCASLADTASLCCALQSDQPVVPPEGGAPVEDLLVLVDPDVPTASKLAANCALLGEVYTSVVLCRDLHMYTGRTMRVALHAHTLLAVVQPPSSAPRAADVEAQMRRQYLGRAYQCPQCHFGPIDHYACGDLEAHNGEMVDRNGAMVNNSCPNCKWFSPSIHDWQVWDGTVPASAMPDRCAGDVSHSATSASLDVALRICYSARSIWGPDVGGPMSELCEKMKRWDTALTSADGVDHPVQILLALACCDELDPSALKRPPVLTLLNEVCARRARDDLRMAGGADEPAVVAMACKRVAAFLGVTAASAPAIAEIGQSEPCREAVRENCSGHVAVNCDEFDFEEWVSECLRPWVPALQFVCLLRKKLQTRGGWDRLARDMEQCPSAFEDVITALQKPVDTSLDGIAAFLEIQPSNVKRVFATVAAQAFLHQSSQSRRTTEVGGTLSEPLGDVRDAETLHELAKDLRMKTYTDRVAEKMRQWHRIGSDVTIARARAVDIGQYATFCGNHVHGLDGPTFWGLWRAAKADGYHGEKVMAFLSRANCEFVSKYGS